MKWRIDRGDCHHSDNPVLLRECIVLLYEALVMDCTCIFHISLRLASLRTAAARMCRMATSYL